MDARDVEEEYFKEANTKKVYHQMTLRSNLEFGGFDSHFGDIKLEAEEEVSKEETVKKPIVIKHASLENKSKSLF